jgi:uncharacterized RDD family membrane protein YckC
MTTQLPRGLVSTCPKADIKLRLFAATTDGLIVVATARLYGSSGWAAYLAAGAAYLLLRDAMRGQSIGKLACGLVVISLETGRPASLAASVRRKALLLLPLANVLLIFLEGMLIVRDPQGQRLGDRLAQTQVVEGFGAKDLVKSFQHWLMTLGADARRAGERRRRAPVRVDRAA